MRAFREKSARLVVLAMALAGLTTSPFPPEKSHAQSANEQDSSGFADTELASQTSQQSAGRIALERASDFLDEGENAREEDERRERYDRAVREAERAVALLPESADAHFVLFGARGRLAQMSGLTTVALALPGLNRQLDKVLQLDPDHPDALAAKGGMLMKLPWLLGGDTTEGVRLLERAVELNPRGAGTRLELAEAYEIAGRNADAIQTGNQAVELAVGKGEVEKAQRARDFVERIEGTCDDCASAEAVP